MDLTFLLPAVLFTLLAVFVATILFNNHRLSPAASQTDNSHSGRALDRSTPPQNPTETPLLKDKGLSPSAAKTSENKESRSLNAERVAGVSGTGVSAEERLTATEVECGSDHGGHEETLAPPSSSSSGRTGSDPSEDTATVEPYRPVSMELSSDPASWPEREPGSTHHPEPEFTSCPFTSHQTGGATQGNAGLEEVDADGLSLKYIPGVLRMSQLEKMMTKEELEAEQRAQQEQLAAIFQLLKENQETFGEVSEGDVEEQLKLYSI